MAANFNRTVSGTEKPQNAWVAVGFSIGATALAHPLNYVKVLIQVGHEPLSSRKVKTLFGKEVLRLPGFLDYAQHIRKVDGWLGLYRGVGPRILHNITNSLITNGVNANFKSEDSEESTGSKPRLNAQDYAIETCQLTIGKTVGVVASYPFHLIGIRMMVQFVGRETYYSSIVSSVKEIYNEDGILGFFSGLVPYLFADVLSFWLFRSFSYVIENYLVDEEFLNTDKIGLYIQVISQFMSSMFTYPFQLVTTCMAVNNTRLLAGQPPLMPIYTSWTACWADLSKKHLLRRGESIFRRTVSKNIVAIN